MNVSKTGAPVRSCPNYQLGTFDGIWTFFLKFTSAFMSFEKHPAFLIVGQNIGLSSGGGDTKSFRNLTFKEFRRTMVPVLLRQIDWSLPILGAQMKVRAGQNQ